MCDYHLEMLSLSQDQQNPSCIQFDDSNWQLHLTSLKPLGLNVLLNLCNASVTERLCRFSDHLCHVALQESHRTVLPVHVPWGLCELARLIGMVRSGGSGVGLAGCGLASPNRLGTGSAQISCWNGICLPQAPVILLASDGPTLTRQRCDTELPGAGR